ncbi:Mu transposase C-terminal domain-containing protein [Microvirga soli]|uniref:Mu transposase C-terminal domain-containing protein n=1 Tax=Microvirga soli TaxID=1854496 RepID=UPI00191CA847|nr:Mu transposase C-terminal domain-containing protein [Microvirga soli]
MEHIIDDYIAEDSVDAMGRPDVSIDSSLVPTLRQFDHFVRTFYSYPRRYRGVHGERAWNLQGRPTLGDAKGDVQGPGDRYYIDATVANVYLRSQLDRTRIVGRPVIYLVVDAYSDMIVGIYVGFEGPSWIGAMMALVNVVTPKVEFCRQFGIDISSDEWPCHHLGHVLQGDSGELKYKLVGENIERCLGMEIDNTPVGRPDLQAPVERRFGTVPATFREFTPGYVEPDFGERGAKDYRVDARLTLREFTAILLYAVLDHNYRPVESKPIPPEMITAGMIGSPLDFWEYGIANGSGELTLASIDEVALNVLCTGRAQVTRKGIRFEGEHYTCTTADREDWFAEARRCSWPVLVSYDPRDLGTFYLRDPKLQGGYEICHVINPNSDRVGTSLVEVRELNRERKATLAATAHDRLRRRIKHRRAVAAIERQAKAKTEAVLDPKLSKNEQVSSIKNNRAEEKNAQRERESFLFRLDPSQRPDDESGLTDATEAMTRFEQDALATLQDHHDRRNRQGQDD